MKNKLGFTLLELLVVVLIIGILASIALPQYRKSVEKSRLSEALINIKSIENAMSRLLLQKYFDEGVPTFEDLDIDFPGSEEDTYVTKDFIYYIYGNNTFWSAIAARPNSYTLKTEMKSNIIQHVCYTHKTKMGRYICESLESQNWIYDDNSYS